MWKTIILLMLVLMLSLMPLVLADSASLDDDISSSDKKKFDEILKPVMKIYNFVKYIASVIAAMFLLYSGIAYMSSGNDPKKRDKAKNIAAYVLIGLVIIWATPIAVNLLI